MPDYTYVGRSLSEPQPTAADREAAAKASLVDALVEGRAGARERYVRDNYFDELAERIGSLEIYMSSLVTGSTVARDGLRELMTEAATKAVERSWAAYVRHGEALDAEDAVEAEGEMW